MSNSIVGTSSIGMARRQYEVEARQLVHLVFVWESILDVYFIYFLFLFFSFLLFYLFHFIFAFFK
jgi:hypothetical protein